MQYEDKDYIIAGLPPSRLGVGRLMAYLVDQNRNDFCIIYPNVRYPESELRTLLKKNCIDFFTQILRYAYSKIVGGLKFNMEIMSLKSKNIILIHPQTIGFKNVIKLIENNNIYIYLMDCSFFCVKSYNHLKKSYNPCFLCLGGNYEFAKKNNCKPFPERYKLGSNVQFLEMLRASSNKITFIVQNSSQADLVVKHFGNNTKVCEVGMFATDFVYAPNKCRTVERSDDIFNVDFVYHGGASEVKGLLYVLDIALKLKQFSFLVPSSYEKCKKIIGNQILKKDLKNVTFIDINWESGLKKYVINSKVVLCPSLWSAPIEGALVKSFIFNGVVALVPTKYSFASDLPESIYCKLDVNCFDKTTERLEELIENEMYRNNLREDAQNWVESFLNDNQPIVKKLKYIVTNEAHGA